jgi:2,4-dienoyl-CoA reductase (NADPH2)
MIGLTANIAWLRRLSHVYMPLGKRVVVIGGGLVGLEVAELLSERGREVTVVEPSANLGAELSVVRRWRVLHTLAEHGVRLLKNTTVTAIERDAVICESSEGSSREAAHNVIIAMGAHSDASFATRLCERGISAMSVGDCAEVGYIEGAIRSAREIALAL